MTNMSERMTDERLAEFLADYELEEQSIVSADDRRVHRSKRDAVELLLSLKAEREALTTLQATLDRVRKLPDKWRELANQHPEASDARAYHVIADDLDAALQHEETT